MIGRCRRTGQRVSQSRHGPRAVEGSLQGIARPRESRAGAGATFPLAPTGPALPCGRSLSVFQVRAPGPAPRHRGDRTGLRAVSTTHLPSAAPCTECTSPRHRTINLSLRLHMGRLTPRGNRSSKCRPGINRLRTALSGQLGALARPHNRPPHKEEEQVPLAELP